MHSGFVLDSSEIDLWNLDFLDTHLDLQHTGIGDKHFVCLQGVFITSWRPTNVCWEQSSVMYVVCSSCPQQVFSSHVRDYLWTCNQQFF